MNFELIARIILVSINAFGLLLCWWVFQSGSKNELKKWFFFMSAFMLLWANFSYFGSRVDNHDISITLYKLNWASVSLFLASFYYFYVIHFLNPGKTAYFFGQIIVFVSSIFFILSIFTTLIVYESSPTDWGNEIIFGDLSNFFNLYSVIVALLVIFYSLKTYIKSNFELQIKLRFFLAGVFIFIFANLVFNVWQQTFFNSVQYQFLGDFSSIILLVFTAYATIQHKLFDVKVIATEAVTTVLLVILFSRIFVSQSNTGRVIDIFVFSVALGFGFLLIRSVSREVKQRKQLEDLNKKLEELDAQKDEFLNVASHELRAPMTAIKGYISMLKNGDAGEIGEEALELLNEASEETERMIRLVNNMLNVARIEEGRMVFEEGVVELSEVVERVFNEFKFEAKEKSLKYIYQADKKLNTSVAVDVDRIHEVVANLINNAVKYTDSGQVEVRLTNPTPYIVRFEVEDTGPGITEEEMKKLFNKFYRTESYVGKKMGTGLGLYISKLLVEKFGGKIGVKSQKNHGSIFWFELPVKQ